MASVLGPHRDTPAGQLLEPARHMCWRVPELALLLSDRAVALARSEGDRHGRLQAEVLALFALNRLGRGAAATGRAIAAVREVESAADSCASELRVELAWCARGSGSHDVAARVLHPVLEQEHLNPVLRAHALVAFGAVTPATSARSTCIEALDEAERLYSTCDLNRDTVLLLRARGRVARAALHRRCGEFADTAHVAADGLDLLDQLDDPTAESGEVHARLVLEQVHALIELGRAHEVAAIAEPVLNRPVRAAAAEPVGWLGLAVATRTHLPDGDRAAAIRRLNDTAAVAERHRLDGLLAETLNTLSHSLEQGSEHEAALHAVRSAYAADRRHRSLVHDARLRLLEEFPAVRDRAPQSTSVGHTAGGPGAGQALPPRHAAPAPRGSGERSRPAEPPAERAQPVRETAAHADDAVPDTGARDSAAPTEIPAAEVAEPAWTSAARPAAEVGEVGELPGLPGEQTFRATDDVRDAARRLMETLTSRTEQQPSAQRPHGMPKPREPQEPGDAGSRVPDPLPGQREAPDLGIDDDLRAHDGGGSSSAPPSERPDQPDLVVPASSPESTSNAPAGALSEELGVEATHLEPARESERAEAANQTRSTGTRASDGHTTAEPDSPFDMTAILAAAGAPLPASGPGSTEVPGGTGEQGEPDEPELLDTDQAGSDEQQPAAQSAHEPAQPEERRRASGRSLAEIQAALQAFEPGGTGRRARHTAPDTVDHHPTPAAEVLAKHGMLAKHHDDWNHPRPADQPPALAEWGTSEQAPGAVPVVEDRPVEEPPDQAPNVPRQPTTGAMPNQPSQGVHDESGYREPRGAAFSGEHRTVENRDVTDDRTVADDRTVTDDRTVADDRAGQDRADAGDVAADESAGEPGQVGLADLLTEALMAYESGRRQSGDPESADPDSDHPEPARSEPPARQGSVLDPAPVGRHGRPSAGNSATGSTGTVSAFDRTPSRARHGAAAEPSGRVAGVQPRHAAFESDPPGETSG